SRWRGSSTCPPRRSSGRGLRSARRAAEVRRYGARREAAAPPALGRRRLARLHGSVARAGLAVRALRDPGRGLAARRPRDAPVAARPARPARRADGSGDAALGPDRAEPGNVRLEPLRPAARRPAGAGDSRDPHDLGHPALGERRRYAELGAADGGRRRRLRARRGGPLLLDSPLGDLERAEPADLPQPELAEGVRAAA